MAALLGVTLILAGCGGSSPSSTSTPAHAASVTTSASPAAGAATTSTTASGGAKRSQSKGGGHSTPSATSTSTATGSSTAGHHHQRVVVAVPHGQNPCIFLTAAQARAIIGSPIVSEVEAPLGPTCIVTIRGRREPITIAVEAVKIKQLAKEMRQPRPVTVAGHAAYCGTLGQPTLDVSLAGGKVLNITAPCVVAEQIAARALPHIAA
jgi:hypothetical protein